MTLALSVMEAIENRIANRHVLDHPFYQAWNAGTLTREALQDYAAQYYHHVFAFPAYLSSVHSNTTDTNARRVILQNLIDEEAGSPNHPELWLQFAKGLGVDRNTVLNTPAEPETAALVSTFRNLSRSEKFTDGIAALYAYESQIPEVSATKIAGLKANYGITDEPTLRYFAVHVDADEVHRAQEKDLLETHITTDAEAASAICATEQALDAVWNLLSGVCARHNIACH